MSTAPTIAPEGVTSILSRLAPSVFGMALNLSMSVGFESHGERIDFELNNADNEPSERASAEFLAIVAEHQDVIAERLEAAREQFRAEGTEVKVPLEGLSDSPLWPVLSLTAGPFIPDEDEDDDLSLVGDEDEWGGQ